MTATIQQVRDFILQTLDGIEARPRMWGFAPEVEGIYLTQLEVLAVLEGLDREVVREARRKLKAREKTGAFPLSWKYRDRESDPEALAELVKLLAEVRKALTDTIREAAHEP